jgi:uncharacterized damage-inducible protein DinB
MSQALIESYQRLARYNRLANERLYGACAQLSDLDRKRERPAFFKSIHGTLNHIMVGDRIWLARFAGHEVPSTGLDAVLFDEFEDLRAARVAEDARIEAFAAGLTGAVLDGWIRYVNNEGRTCDDPTAVLVTHLFNHQTHHRGQVHDMLSQTNVAPPSLDLHRVLLP